MSKLQYETPEFELHSVGLEKRLLVASAEQMNPVPGSWDEDGN